VSSPVSRRLRGQRGVFVIEFALVATLFFMLLFGVIEFGRLLWTWNAAAEATRLGARMAVVCDKGEAQVLARMRERLPYLQTSHISVQFSPPGCTSADCQTVTVSLAGYVHEPIIPFIDLSVTLPPFQTSLPKEYMKSSGNPVCS
jgi:TadE-like protein